MKTKKKTLKKIEKKKVETDFFSRVKSFFEKNEKELKKNQRKQFTWFIAGFLFFYLLFTGVVIPFENSLKEVTAKSSMNLLSIQGVEVNEIGFIEFNGEQSYSFMAGEKQIVISWLCAGFLEIIILVSAILASFGIAWKKKIIGAILAVVIGFFFNLLRVWFTINLIFTQNSGTVELAHDLLFRILLFIYITVFYVIWFYYSKKK